MHKFVLSVLLFLSFQPYAQDMALVDSLTSRLQEDLSDLVRVDIYNQLAFEYVNTDSAITHSYVFRSIDLAKEIKYQEGIADAYLHLGWTTFRSGNLDQAILIFQQSIDQAKLVDYQKGIAQGMHGIGAVLTDKGSFQEAVKTLNQAVEINLSINELKGLALSYNQLGIVNAYRGDYRACLDFFLKALEIQLQRGDQRLIAGNYNNIAQIYGLLDDTEKEAEYLAKSIAINEKSGQERGLAINYNNMVPLLLDLGKTSEALEYANKAVEMNQQINSNEGLANAYAVLGSTYFAMDRFEQAIDYLNQSLELSNEMGDAPISTSLNHQIGEAYLALNQLSLAQSYLQQAETAAIAIKDPTEHSATLETLARLYEARGNYKEALAYQIAFKELSDSLLNDERQRQTDRLEAEFEFRQERDSIARTQSEERSAFQADIASRQSRQRLTYLGLIILFGLLGMVVYFFRAKQKSNQELLKLNEEITQQRDHLEKLNQTKTRLFSIISHDIRAPMSVFTGFSDILVEHVKETYNAAEDKEVDRIKNYIHDASDRILHLMDDLVRWAQKEEGVVPYHPQVLVADRIMEETLEILAPQVQSKNIRLESQAENGLIFWADKNSCKTIFRNLLSNAIKFTPEGGHISFNGSSDNVHVEFAIKDTGIGIAEDQIVHLFELSKDKVRRGTKGEVGIGLGLNVVYEFVKMNQGDILVESKEGDGTTFTVRLPAKEPQA